MATWRSPAVMKSATGIAAVALLAVGSWSMRGPATQLFTRAFESSPTSIADASPVQQVAAAQRVQDGPQPLVARDSFTVADTPDIDADSIRWIPAVARTWVNVRSDASRGGDVVGVIKPSEKAMLGVGRAGWRQVRSPDITGWVDPRLFEADSLRIRG